MHKPLKVIEPVQMEFDFKVPFTFKDSIAKISRKNPMRGSVLQSLLGDVCQNKKVFFGDSLIIYRPLVPGFKVLFFLEGFKKSVLF